MKKIKYFLILSLLLVAVLVVGCKKNLNEGGTEGMKSDGLVYEVDDKNVGNTENTNATDTKTELETIPVYGEYISDIYTNKSAYMPGETVKVILHIKNPNNDIVNGLVRVTVKHLNQSIDEQQNEVVLNSGEEKDVELVFAMPDEDFKGYAVEAYLYDDETLLDAEMTAIDVSSDWYMFPRYGYLTNMEVRTEEKSREVLLRLLKHHINGLFYYDVIDRHDKPLAGTVETPEEKWNTLAWKQASQKTVLDMIEIGHEYNMNSFIYNLIFGAYDNFEDLGVKKEWGLFKDAKHANQDNHDLSGLHWETKRLWLFNPANKDWQDHYLKVHKELFEVFPYDGIQVDSLGSRGNLYDYDGNQVKLNETYASLLNRLSGELNTKVLFNPVSGYGMSQQLKEVAYDILYMEVWPGDHDTYASLKIALDNLYRSTKGQRGSVIAAYMNYEKRKSSGGSFNTAGVNYTNAVLLASGGSHLELGDTGMLSGEYYPGSTLQVNDELAGDLRNYYSFMVAYENLLRGPGLEEKVVKTYVDDTLTSYNSEVGKIWSFTKIKDQSMEIIHLINFIKASHVAWVDEMGTQTAPEVLTGRKVKHYVSIEPTQVGVASPDYKQGVFELVDFEVGNDEAGKYVLFELPSLEYWTMVIIQ
ncbi:MAG: hypothetical protein K0R21_451 [Anaerocolumna sp.]|jgi:dextranase|nr:hypothetical protein [Anaerocolumna sp.]